jgi:aminoacrylate hydrolase
MPRISIGDCEIYYERQGAGFPLLLITGLGGNASHWREQVPAFAQSFDTIVYDHRGIGRSDHDKIVYSVDKMAADAVALLDALGIDRAHVVGHSTGGAIAQILALERPERLAAIVIAASWTKADAYFRRLFAMRRETLERFGPASYMAASSLFLYPSFYIARHDETLKRVEAQMLAAFSPAEITLSRIDAILQFDRTAELGRIATPTLVIGTGDDLVTPTYFSEELARAIPGATLAILPQGGHFSNIVFPRAFNEIVIEFLTAQTPVAASVRGSANL